MNTTTIAGGFCDITFHAGDFYIARMNAGRVYVDRYENDTFNPVADFECEGNGFPRLKSVEDLWLAYREQNGQVIHVRNLSQGTEHVHRGTFYNWPVALGVAGYAINSADCKIFNYTGELAQTLPALANTGIAYLDGQNRPVSNDDNRGSQPGMYNPSFSDGLFCGEGLEGGVPCVYQDDKRKTFNPFTIANVPKVAKHGERDEWAIVANDDKGVVTLYKDITAADFEVVPEPPIPVPEPTPGLYPAEVRSVYAPNKKGEFRFTVKVKKGVPAPQAGDAIEVKL